MKYDVRAFDKAGKPVVEVVDAPDAAEARENVRRRGLFVAEVVESRGAVARRETTDHHVASGKRLQKLSGFTRQLSVLVSTGTPLVEALGSLERQAPEGEWRTVLADLRQCVEEGKQFSEALERHPQYFDAIARSLISAGESGGKLDAMLDRLSKLVRQQEKVRSQLRGALVYPCLLIFVSVGVLGLMIGFVLPRFEGLFKTLGTPLPPMTAVLMGASGFLREFWWELLIGLVVSGAALKLWLSSVAGRVSMDRLLVVLPKIGPITRNFATARVVRMLGVLLEAKVALLDALQLTRQSAGNVLYAEMLERAEQIVTKGENVSTAFTARAGERELIPVSVCEALRSGERTGRMGAVLVSIAEAMDEDNEILVKALTSILEPVILIVLGLVVGTVATSMFLPLFDLTAAAQSGGAPGGGS